ncbi:ANTAR domain-containing protein [Geodermatophilus sp. URMC 61]|uniref:ANTAR domain-containing protein n=1 Tax=Geodermatophilus sp. URMC 61 TaxID=3423411 RepID=UPI00406CFDB9
MDTATRFVETLDADTRAAADDPDLLPVRLAHAAATVLPVEGVGLSIHGEPGLRTPLAASSEVVAIAERLQFTAGSGPCLFAAESGLPVFATEEILARRWPAFHDLLVTHTPLRSVLALSLPGRLKGLGGMDLYLAAADGAIAVDVFAARCVAELVSDHLDLAADWSVWTPTELPAWSDTPDARRRGRLWLAVGMLMLALQAPAPDALAVLRGYAYAAGRTADDVAIDLVERRLRPEQLREDAGSPGQPTT